MKDKSAQPKQNRPGSFRSKMVALGAILMLALTGCTSISTAPDEVGLWYKAGPFTATAFDHCVDAGTLERWKGVSDQTYLYPAGLRTYSFSDTKPNSETKAFSAPTKDPVYLDVEGYITYNITTNCTELQRFHETIGLKYEAWNDGNGDEGTGATSAGWIDMLNQYLGNSLQDALTRATAEYGWKEIYSDTAVAEKWKKKVTDYLPQAVKNSMGGDYFQNFAITLQKPKLPDSLKNATQTREVSKTELEAQEQKNKTVEKELEAIREVVKVVGKENYALLEAVKHDKVTVIGVPTGGGVALTTDGKAAEPQK